MATAALPSPRPPDGDLLPQEPACCVCLLEAKDATGPLLGLHDSSAATGEVHLCCIDCLVRWAVIREQGGNNVVTCPLCRLPVSERTLEIVRDARGIAGAPGPADEEGGGGISAALERASDYLSPLAETLGLAFSSIADDVSAAFSSFLGGGVPPLAEPPVRLPLAPSEPAGAAAAAPHGYNGAIQPTPAELEEDEAYIQATIAAMEMEEALQQQQQQQHEQAESQLQQENNNPNALISPASPMWLAAALATGWLLA